VTKDILYLLFRNFIETERISGEALNASFKRAEIVNRRCLNEDRIWESWKNETGNDRTNGDLADQEGEGMGEGVYQVFAW
jgi:hypothetical protein